MKKVLLSVIGLVAFAMTMGLVPESIETFFAVGGVMASLPLWFTMKGELKEFNVLSTEQLKGVK